jgi:hypothetical protein
MPSPGQPRRQRAFTAAVFAEAAKLPEPAQDRIAATLLQELADEAKWDASFAASASASRLERLAAQALEEYRAGRTEELGFDEL